MNLLRKIISSVLFIIVACTAYAQSSVQFDGNDDYIYIQKTDAYDVTAFTIMAWVKWGGGSLTDYYGIASNYSGGGSNQHYGIRMSDQGKASVFIDNGSSSHAINGTSDINDGEWHHISGVFEGGNFIKVYVDGFLEGTLSTSSTQLTPTSDFYIGVDGITQGESDWNGYIDNVSIWNYGLNKSYIEEWRYKEFSGKEPGLIGFWPMNEVFGTNTKDLTGNSNGILQGDASFGNSEIEYNGSIELPDFAVAQTGSPYNVIITDVNINGLEAVKGTYIQLYDGTLCVGSALYNTEANTLVVTWEGNQPQGIPGFTNGNTIVAKVYTEWYSNVHIFEGALTFERGDGTFGDDAFSVAEIHITTAFEPLLETNKSLLNFNTVLVGETKNDTLILTNTGNATIQIQNVITTNPEFSVSQTGFTLKANETDTIFVGFTPASVVDKNESLTITTDIIENPTTTIQLHGTGLPAETTNILVTPQKLTLGNLLIGDSVATSFYVYNKGNALLNVSGITSSNPNFKIKSSTSFSLNQGENREIEVMFTPTEETLEFTNIQISSNDVAQNVSISGIGVGSHFTPVDATGKPYSIVIEEINIEGVKPGPNDQIGVFDDTLCVGTGLINLSSEVLTLDGNGDYAITPNMVTNFPTESVTLEIWFKALRQGVVVSENGNTSLNSSWHDSQIEIVSNGEVRVRLWNFSYIPLGIIEFGTWNHVAIRYDHYNQRLSGFLNGAKASIERTGNRLSPWESGYGIHYLLGASETTNMGSGQWFQGQLDEFRVWKVALSDQEIANNMNKDYQVSSANLIGHWNFSNGALVDRTGNNSNLGLVGNPFIEESDCPLDTRNLLVTVWEEDIQRGLAGFKPGNTINYKVYTSVYDIVAELDAIPTYSKGDGTFGNNSFSVVRLSADLGSAPKMRVPLNRLNVGQIQLNDTTSKAFYIYNEGTAPLNVSFQEASANFWTDTSDASIQPNDSLKVIVSFTSSNVGNHIATLTVNSDDPLQELKQIQLEAFVLPEGVANIDVSLTTLAFKTLSVGDTAVLTFNVINNGTAPLIVSNISSSDPSFEVSPASFTLNNTNDNQEITVVFRPTSKGYISGVLTVVSNAGNKAITTCGVATDGHFSVVESSGLPYSIIVDNNNLAEYLKPGDEIAVFDGDKCVGRSELSNVGNSLVTNSNSQRMQIPSLLLSDSYTIEAWAKFPLPTTGDYRTLVQQGHYHHHVLVSSSGYLGTYVNGFYTSGYNVNSLQGWHHIAAVGSGNTTKFYVDGKSVGTAGVKEGNPINYVGNHIGNRQQFGTIDEFRVWNYARSEQEIQISMNVEINPNSSGLIGYWDFDGNLINKANPVQEGTLLNNAHINGEPAHVFESNIQIVAWEEDVVQGYNGFTPGNPISFRIWSDINGFPSEFVATPTFLVGDGTFGYGQLSVVNLDFSVPIINVQPLILFQALDEPDSVDVEIQVINLGLGALEYTVQELADSAWLKFDIVGDTVAAGDTSTLKVSINSTGLIDGIHTDTIQVFNNTPFNSPVNIPITLNVTGQGELELTNEPLVFDSLLVGNTETDFLGMLNAGTKTLTIDAAYFINGSVFRLSQAFPDSIALNPAQSANLSIAFTPVSSGNVNDTLVIVTQEDTITAVVSGYGITPPEIAVDIVEITDTLEAGSSYVDTLYLSNYGLANLSFQLKNSIPWLSFKTETGTIQESDTLAIEYNISTIGLVVGDYSGNVEIESNDPYNPTINLPVNISVKGKPELTAPDFHKLGDAIIGDVIASKYIIQNTGADTLEITSLLIPADSIKMDAIILPLVINPNESDTLTFTFSPSEIQTYSGILTIVSNDTDNSPYAVAVTGEGLPVPPEISIVDDTVHLTSTSGGTPTAEFEILNLGGQDLIFNLEQGNSSGNAIYLDGNGDYLNVRLNNSTVPVKEITIEAWINPETTSGTHSIISKEGSAQSFNFKQIGSALALYINNQQVIVSSNILTASEYQYVAATYDGLYIKLFRNGIEVASKELPSLLISPNSENVRIGRSFNNEFFFGSIDEIRLWNKALDISALNYNMDKSVDKHSDGLILYFDFEKKANSVYTDVSVYENQGTVYGNVTNIQSGVSLNQFFSFTPTSGTIASESSYKVEVSSIATEIAEGTYVGIAEIASNDTINPLVKLPVSLVVDGTPDVAITMDTLEFDPTYQTSSDTAFFTINNNGSAELILSNFTSGSPVFSGYKTGYSIPAFTSIRIPLFFKPELALEYIARLDFETNDPDASSVSLALKGIGMEPPVISLSSDTVKAVTDFLVPVQEEFTIYNTGSGTLKFNIQADGVKWLTVDPPFGSVPSQDSLTVDFIFDPTNPGGLYTTGLILQSNALNSTLNVVPVEFTVIGAQMSLTPEALYDTTTVDEPVTDTLYIANLGPEPLTFSLREYVYWMSLSRTSGVVLPNQQEKIIVSYNADIPAGQYSSNINIQTNDVNARSIYYPVNYTVLPPELIVTPEDLSLGGILLGESKSRNLTLFNNGITTVTIDSVVIDAPFTSDFTDLTILPDSTKYIEVRLDAEQKTLYSGQALVYSDEGRIYPVNLFAEGIEMPEPVTNMLPADSSVDILKPILFSWAPALNAKSYSIVISNIDSTKEFTIKDITNISYSYNAEELSYGESYTWKVISQSYEYSVDGPTQQFTIRELPDLIVSNMEIPRIAFSGRSSEVEWTVRNIGIDKTIGDWYDYAYLSLDTILQPQFDIFLGGTSNISYLEVNESYNQIKEFTLPNGISGNYYLIVKTNASNRITEISTANNTSVSDTLMFVDLTPPPDLRIFSTNAPSLVFSGQETTAQWTVKNYGTGPTAESIWYDNIYISDTTVWGEGYWKSLGSFQHKGVLEKDSSYTVVRNITMPESISGAYYLHVFTDSRSNVYEHACEQNNTSVSDSIQVILTPPADLVVSDINVSDTSAANGDQVLVEWVIDNYGGSETKSKWKDGIYLLQEGKVDFSNAIKIAELTHETMLNAGDFLIVNKNVIVPDNLKDKYYVYVKTDIENAIDELSFEDNNLSDSVELRITYSDFTIASVEHVDTIGSGDSLEVKFYLQNSGTGIYSSKNVCVSVGVSNNTVYDETVDEFASVCVAPDIAVNDCTLITLNEPLPQGVYGIKNLLVTADYEDNIYEGDIEDNNTHVSQLAINLNRWVDLNVSSISNPDTIKAGSSHQINYSIQNIGTKDLANEYIETEIYILNEDQLSCGAKCGTLLQTITREYTIACKDSITDSLFIAVPNITPAGNHVFFVVVDVTDNIFEHIGETNNSTYNPVYIDKIPVDLAINKVTADTVMYSGKNTNVSWEVQNAGTMGTNAKSWHDAVYLSTDTILNAGDIELVKPRHNGALGAMQSYSASANFEVPNGMDGSYYLLVATDVDYITSDNDYSNNHEVLRDTVFGHTNGPIIIKVILSASADLELTQLVTSGTAIAGQPLAIEYTVENNGDTIAYPNWTDRIYLSKKTEVDNIDWKDIYLGSHTRTAQLPNGESYTVKLDVTIPLNIIGNYLLVVVTDIDDKVYEHNGESNNILVSPLNIELAPPSDLIVESVTIPASAIAGEEISINWSIQNIGSNPAKGYKKDIVYLSADTVLDESDIVFGMQENRIDLAPYGLTSNSLTSRLLGTPVGEYNVIVKTDVLNNINEESDENNSGSAIGTLSIDVKSIGANDSVSDVLENEIELYYRLDVDSDLSEETVLLQLFGDNMNALNELYVKYNDMPSRADHDLAYQNLFGGEQEIIIPDMQIGTYYILAIGSTIAGTTQDISLTTEVLEFEIISLSPHEVGNTGMATLKLVGAKFSPDMSIFLEHKDSDREASPMASFLTTRFDVSEDAVDDTIKLSINEENKIKAIYVNAGDKATPENADFTFIGPVTSDTILYVPLYLSDYYYMTTILDTSSNNNLGLSIHTPYSVSSKPLNTDVPNGFLQAEDVFYMNSTVVYARFNFKNTALGDYHIHLNNHRELCFEENQVTVVQGLLEDLQINVVYPSSVRAGAKFSMMIEYKNNGNTDIKDPYIIIESFAGAPMSETVEGLSDNLTKLKISLKHPLEPENLLRPGAYGTKTIFIRSSNPIGIGVSKY